MLQIEGQETIVWGRGSIEKKQTVSFSIKAWQALGGFAANTSGAMKYLLKQVEELASNLGQQPVYIQWTATADPAALLNATELHDGWYLIDDFEPDYGRNVVTGLVICRMTATEIAAAPPRRVAYGYSGGALSTNYSGGALNLLSLPVGSTALEASVTRTAAEGSIPCILSPIAAPEPVALSTTIANIFKGGVHVYDTINTGSNPVPTSGGTFVHANWVEVFDTRHDFQGDCVVTNGLLLLLFVVGSVNQPQSYLWNTATATANWQQFGLVFLQDSGGENGLTRAYSLVRVGPEECSIAVTSSGSTNHQAKRGIYRLQRGRYECRLDFTSLTEATASAASVVLSLPATIKLAYNSSKVADNVLSETAPAFATDYGYGAVFVNNSAQSFIAGFLYQNEPGSSQPALVANNTSANLGDTTSLALNAQRSYGFFALPYGVNASYSTANLQAEAEGGTLDAGWTSVVNAAMSGGNEAKCASGTVAGRADVFGTAFVPAVGTYDAWFRYRVTSTIGNAAEMQMGLWDSTSSAFVASTTYKANQGTYAPTIFTDTPVAFWRLDDTGASAVDIANAHNGTLAGGITQSVVASATADGDTAMTFNGTTGVITVPTAAALHPGDTFSIEFWIKTTAVAISGIFDSGAANDYQVAIDATGHILCAKAGVGNLMTSTAAYNDGAWHHVVWTKATTTNKLYVDGADVTPAVSNLTIVAGATSITMAKDQSARFLAGSLDEVAFYSVALSAAQVTAHYAARLAAVQAWVRAATAVTPTAGHNMRFRAVTALTLGTDWFIDEAVLLPKTLTADDRGPQDLWQQFIYDRSVRLLRQ